ncbi:sporulation protein YqfC [Melghirimyces profundicolus]|uniref:Sporulation protein YqfC n=1 Tax=Melghirimyces profundicolus TaxID=1242148 RepID=A0A2T6C975_9BACL|nr:sporulation protein YqfC [Melghirimyces profundicolus]PTX64864.1 sporulation protein YqfC [Melghirimyces profundicolus]
MRNLGSKMKKVASDWLDIPQDIAANLPRVLMIGPYRAHIENHQGVERFSRTELRLKTARGPLSVTGQKLVIHAIYPDEVWVEGEITEVKFLG